MADTKNNNWRFVEIGRVMLFNQGRYANKVGVVLDVVDARRVLVQAPKVEGHEQWTGVPRHVVTLKQVEPTPVKVDIRRMQREGRLVKALKDQDTLGKWAGLQWAKKIGFRKARAETDDITRFRLNRARRTRAYTLRKSFADKLKKAGQQKKAKAVSRA